MTDLNSLDLSGLITQSMEEIFDTMLSIDLVPTDVVPDTVVNGHRIVGSVNFAGIAMGSLRIMIGGDFANIVTAAMLGMEPEEIQGEEEIHDVIGELSNMIGGSLKSHLCDEGYLCELSIPSVTSGSDFKIVSMDFSRQEKIGFQHGDLMVLVELDIKSQN